MTFVELFIKKLETSSRRSRITIKHPVTWICIEAMSLISLDSTLDDSTLERFARLFRAIFGGGAPPQHIFLTLEMA